MLVINVCNLPTANSPLTLVLPTGNGHVTTAVGIAASRNKSGTSSSWQISYVGQYILLFLSSWKRPVMSNFFRSSTFFPPDRNKIFDLTGHNSPYDGNLWSIWPDFASIWPNLKKKLIEIIIQYVKTHIFDIPSLTLNSFTDNVCKHFASLLNYQIGLGLGLKM